MHHRKGLTLVETLLSLALFGSFMATVFSMMAAGQSGFQTSEAYLQAQQVTRNAAGVIEQEIAGAQILNYYVSTNQNVLSYVTFRRMLPGIVDTTSTGSALGTPLWDTSTHYALLWCPKGTAGDPIPFWGNNPCAGITGHQPKPGELVLLKQADVWAAPTVLERVIANDLQTFAQDGQRGFELSLVRPAPIAPCTGDSVSCPATGDAPVAGNVTACGFGAPFSWVCRNEPGHPFQFYAGLPYYNENTPLSLRMDFTIRGRARTWQGRVVKAPDIKGRIFLLNRQDKPL